MFFLLRRWVLTNKSTGQKEYRDTQIRTQRLTIGRHTDQHLQITDCSVEPRHAVIHLRRNNHLYLEATAANRFQVNGKHRRKVTLTPGDAIRIGSATITVEPPRPDYPGVLRFEAMDASGEEKLDALHDTSLSLTGLSKRYWSWLLGIGVLLVFLLVPLYGVLDASIRDTVRQLSMLPDDNLWSSGPLHSSHQFIGKDCNACHESPFQMVENEQCQECHTDVKHHVAVKSTDIELFEQKRCANCHREHKEPGILARPDTRFCSDCHQQLDSLKKDTKLVNVTDFTDDHPEFRLTVLTMQQQGTKARWHPVRIKSDSRGMAVERSNLEFSHKQHLDPQGIKSPKGDQVLVCGDCHQPYSDGRLMKPITMEEHCSRCHSLLFDENDLTSKIPHGKLKHVFETLDRHFSHGFLEQREQTFTGGSALRPSRRPGDKTRVLDRKEQMRALDWTVKRSLKVAEELIENQLCIDCHRVSRNPDKTGRDQWTVEPVAITRHWLPKARFVHATHDTEECDTCHQNTGKSEKSSDILMPDIEDCRECHAAEDDQQKVASDCLMCHQFHLPERGLFDPLQRAATAKVRARKKNKTRPTKNR